MAARLHALVVRTPDPERLSAFWDGLLADSEVPIRLRYAQSDLPRGLLNQIHFHLSSNTASQEATVARALELGAIHLDVGQLPEEGHVVLADPDGNEFCVIEAGNTWLAGTGLLGELAADGTREVGVFWAAALDWPLVHDDDGETAIAPPEGGFKIAWGGPPLNERAPRNLMHFGLVVDDLEEEVARLVGLGAREIARPDDAVELEDPEGNEFSVSAG
ncbi:MAG: VOC family protein [Nocardioides sp.]|nr:VOC family protein [Nocardioides sp.]